MKSLLSNWKLLIKIFVSFAIYLKWIIRNWESLDADVLLLGPSMRLGCPGNPDKEICDFLIEVEHDSNMEQQFMRNHRNLYATAFEGIEDYQIKAGLWGQFPVSFDVVILWRCPSSLETAIHRHLQNRLWNVWLQKTINATSTRTTT